MSQHIKRSDAPPSPPAYGGLIALFIFATVVVLLTYTLFPLPGQLALGAWNYVIAAGCVVVAAVLARSYVPTPWIEQEESFRIRSKPPSKAPSRAAS